MRRSLLALGISLAVHAFGVAAVVGTSTWQTLSLAPKIQVRAIDIDLVKDLPLGAPPAKEIAKTPETRVRPRRPRHRATTAHENVVVPKTPDASAPESGADAGPKTRAVDGGDGIDGGRRRPGDLRSSGPEGSRVVALLRLDRLRASPESEKTIAAVDQLLTLLPDRHRLIEGTGFDLYRDFDNLLIATPDPRDAAVTFLAVRHHLGDAALKAGLDRGGRAANRPIRWRTVDGRPVGIRQQSKNKGRSLSALDRDDRILVLPAGNVAIIATPAYAAQLLGTDSSPQPGKMLKPRVDGGTIDAGSAIASPTRVSWRDIVARIEAEDAVLPDDAAFMITATNLFVPGSASPGVVAPPPRGAVDDTPAIVAPGAERAPEVASLVVGVEPAYITLVAEFQTEADAEGWERELPVWRRRLLTNPVVLLSGFSPLIQRAKILRNGSTLELRVDTTIEEIQRLLNLLKGLTGSALVTPR